jgi:hypothetical protein
VEQLRRGEASRIGGLRSGFVLGVEVRLLQKKGTRVEGRNK